MKTTWISLSGIGIVVAATLFWSTTTRAGDRSSASPSLEQRVAVLETRIENLQRVMGGIDLADDAAIESILAEARAQQEWAALEADAFALLSMRHTIWGQLELYTMVEGGYPDLLRNGWQPLLGKYLPEAPVNPFTGSSAIVSRENASADAGWVWDPKTGAIFGIAPQKVISRMDAYAGELVGY